VSELDADQRESLRAYADATRPSPAEVERALARTLARVESSRRRSSLPNGRRRFVWVAAAGFATLLLATAALAGIRWLRGQSRAPTPSHGEARFERALPPEGAQAQRAAPGGERAEAPPQPEAPLPAAEPGEAPPAASAGDTEAGSAGKAELPADPSSGEAEPSAGSDAARDSASARKPNSPPKPASKSAAKAPPVVDAGELADESRLLARARKALDANDYAGALDWVEEHAHRHPHGALEEERLILEAVAACRGGQRRRGLDTLATLRQRFAGSPTLTKVERACE
jgi:hypothetical protein